VWPSGRARNFVEGDLARPAADILHDHLLVERLGHFLGDDPLS
jgi:hypothetical protein